MLIEHQYHTHSIMGKTPVNTTNFPTSFIRIFGRGLKRHHNEIEKSVLHTGMVVKKHIKI